MRRRSVEQPGTAAAPARTRRRQLEARADGDHGPADVEFGTVRARKAPIARHFAREWICGQQSRPTSQQLGPAAIADCHRRAVQSLRKERINAPTKNMLPRSQRLSKHERRGNPAGPERAEARAAHGAAHERRQQARPGAAGVQRAARTGPLTHHAADALIEGRHHLAQENEHNVHVGQPRARDPRI